MIRNTFEFYQHHGYGYGRRSEDDTSMLMREFRLAYSAPMNSDDTAESIAERLRKHPPADFICDFDRVASILMMDRDGEKECVLFENGEVLPMTEDIMEELKEENLTMLDGLPGLWSLYTALFTSEDYFEVRDSAEDSEYRVRFLTTLKNKVICRVSNDPFDMELADAFKKYALAHGVSERELTHVSVGSSNAVVSPDGGLWEYAGTIQTFYGVVYLMKNAIQSDFYVLMDKSCNLLARLDKAGIDKEIVDRVDSAIWRKKYPESAEKDADLDEDEFELFTLNDKPVTFDEEDNESVTSDDEDDELDEWYDDDYTPPKRRNPLWLRLWKWFCGLFRHKKSQPDDGGSTGK